MWPHDCVRHAEPLANYTSFRIGGPAEWFAEPSTVDELVGLLNEARHLAIPVTVMGGGTNCLVADRGVRGLVIRLGRAFRTVETLAHAEDGYTQVHCGASVITQRLVNLAGQHGWGGLDILAGLPGQVGGAVMMNAQNIGQFVDQVRVASFNGAKHVLTREQLRFSYRYTAMDPGIVTDVIFRFAQVTPADAADQIRRTLAYRNDTQDLKLPSAGCAFKNPPGQSAGRMIDQAGLKGARIGDAQVSRRHANFIVNIGQATCDDVLSLMEHIQRRVLGRFGLRLEPEVRLMGERW